MSEFKPTTLTRTEWFQRCKARYIEAGIDEDFAQQCAEATTQDFYGESEPEEAAEDDMTAWGDCI